MGTLIVRRRGEPNETLNMLGEQFTVLAAGEETSSYEVFVQIVPPGSGPPLHSHPWHEAFYVLDGELDFSTGEQNLRAPIGTFVHFPAGSANSFASRGGTATILSLTSRPGAAAHFRESHRVNSEFPGDFEKLVAVAGRHGLRLRESPEQFALRTGSPSIARS